MPLKSFIAYFALLAVAFATGPPDPNHSPAPTYGKGTVYEDRTAVYQYEYALQDDYSGDNIRKNEHRDGYSTGCQYRVLLPDGSTQIVTYNTADAYSGNVAEVVYEGTASCAPAPVHKVAPKPIYKLAPVYTPTPCTNQPQFTIQHQFTDYLLVINSYVSWS